MPAKKGLKRHTCVRSGRHTGYISSAKGKYYGVTIPSLGVSKRLLKKSSSLKRIKCSKKLKKNVSGHKKMLRSK